MTNLVPSIYGRYNSTDHTMPRQTFSLCCIILPFCFVRPLDQYYIALIVQSFTCSRLQVQLGRYKHLYSDLYDRLSLVMSVLAATAVLALRHLLTDILCHFEHLTSLVRLFDVQCWTVLEVLQSLKK